MQFGGSFGKTEKSKRRISVLKLKFKGVIFYRSLLSPEKDRQRAVSVCNLFSSMATEQWEEQTGSIFKNILNILNQKVENISVCQHR